MVLGEFESILLRSKYKFIYIAKVDQDLLMDSDCVEDAEGRAGESAAVN